MLVITNARGVINPGQFFGPGIAAVQRCWRSPFSLMIIGVAYFQWLH